MTKKAVADWDQIDFGYPKNLPTMISREERRFLYWLGSRKWTGFGHIVEMGPWLGGSTLCLAAGMKASGLDARSKLHVYDAFVWRDFMSDRSPHNLADGESFESLFRHNVREYSDLIVVNQATLPDEAVQNDTLAAADRHHQPEAESPVVWTSGEPVEILFVDGAKSWSGFLALLKAFSPYLVPNRSLLVFQDYKSWRSYWVSAMVEILADQLALEHVLRQNTVTFRVTSPIDREALQSVPEWPDLDSDHCERLIDRSADRLEKASDKLGAAIVRLSSVRMWMHRGNVSRAIRRFKEEEKAWPLRSRDANLRWAREWLMRETNQPLPSSVRTRFRHGLVASEGALRSAIRYLKPPKNRKT